MTRISSAHPAAAPSPFGTTIALALLLVVSDLTGKLPPSVMAERRRYYSGQNRQNNNYRQRSERGRQRKAESGPASGQNDRRGAVRRKLEDPGGELLIPGGVVLDSPVRPGNMQPLGFDATTSNSNGLLFTTSNGMGSGLDLLEQLFGEDFELVKRDPSECEACENCLQCIDCSKCIYICDSGAQASDHAFITARLSHKTIFPDVYLLPLQSMPLKKKSVTIANLVPRALAAFRFRSRTMRDLVPKAS